MVYETYTLETRIQKNKAHHKYIPIEPPVEEPMMIGRLSSDAYRNKPKKNPNKPRRSEFVWDMRETLFRLGFLDERNFFYGHQQWMREVDWL